MYEVCDIEVVLPEETQILGAEPDRDLVTLLTCTPYGQNTHRLLVTGQRIADDAQTDVAHKADNRQRRGWKSQWMTSYAKAVCFSVGILLVLYCVCRGVHIVQIRKRKNMSAVRSNRIQKRAIKMKYKRILEKKEMRKK